ncbi:MAG: DedA family protein [Panacagrimonas sp.]|jgi:membrane protein DedA with SNARE-associated domain|nr:DedA family protein [Panacagrimonas sp.]MCC2656997.1 DedA family protein [Panacagrimonas sp.]
MEAFALWVKEVVAHLGYTEIVFLMALESSLFPVPSELVMIPAGYRAAQGELNPFLATLCGGLGSLIGASANYALGKYVGKVFLLAYGKYFLISPKTFHDAEQLFLRNANVATFVGRFIPGIRHLISIPPGVFGMRLAPFMLLTTLGATLWCGVLTALGYYFGQPVIEAVMAYTHEAALLALVGLLVFVVWFVIRHRAKRNAVSTQEPMP